MESTPTPPSRSHPIAGPFWALVLAVLGACRAPGPRGPRPAEWFELGTAAFLRDDSASPEVDDDSGWLIGGGFDLLQGGLRLGPEFELSGSDHDVEPSLPGTSPSIGALTFRVGARAQFDLASTLFGAHLRAGLLWREEQDHGGALVANDQGGVYAGAGLDLWFEDTAALSLFVLASHLEDDGQDEAAVGLTARFYFGEGAPW